MQLKVSEMQASGDNSDQWTTEILWVAVHIQRIINKPYSLRKCVTLISKILILNPYLIKTWKVPE